MKKTYLLGCKLALTLFLVLLTSVSYSQNQTFTSSGTFTVPVGVTSITVEAWGGGGKGGTRTNNSGGAGGGGGGAYVRSVLTVVPTTSYTVTVGAGSTSTAAGGDSWFGSNTLLLAKGGESVANNTTGGGNGGAAGSSIGDFKRSGGNGANGSALITLYGGGGGSSAGTALDGVSGNTANGGTAPAGGGNGGAGVGSGTQNAGGTDGSNPGGGGGGAKKTSGSSNRNGGDGGNGQVIITYTLPNGPGGVTSALQLWLRADLVNGTSTVTDNTNVTSWQTQAMGSNATVHTAGQEPKYKNNQTDNVNFNAVIDFDNISTEASSSYNYALAGQQYLGGSTGYYTQDVFVVVIPNVTVNSSFGSMDIFCADSDTSTQTNDATGVGFGAYSQRFNNEVLSYAYNTSSGLGNGYGVAETSTSKTYSNVGIINTRNNSGSTAQELFYNGLNVVNTTSAGTFMNLSNGKYWIGRSEGWKATLDGRVAEIITFSSRKNDASERIKIESYLAIKYGITMGVNGTSQNYVNSDGTVIWNTTANAGFNWNIAGIGRDDLSKLNQKQSRSVNLATDVAIGLGEVAATNTANATTFSTNKDYLVWGCNNGSFASSGTTTNVNLGGLTTSFISGNRKWKIVETGTDVGQTVVSLPKSSLTSNFTKTATQEYVLIVSSSSAFGSNDIVDIIPLTDTGSNYEAWYDFDTTKYFSFGVANQFDSKYRLDNQTGDFVLGEKNINLNSSFTVSGWIRHTSGGGAVLAKNGAYQFYINASNKLVGNWNGADRITSITSINNGKWHYVAVTFASGTANLYIDGVLDATASSLPTPVSNTANFSIGAVWQGKSTITSTFSGDIDEIRIWSNALTSTQIRFVMNQEIEKTGTATNGRTIPSTITKNDISVIPWNSLQAYYDLNTFYGTSIKDKSDNNRWARIKYLTVDKNIVGTQTAPMPYVSTTDGAWATIATWTNGTLQELPNNVSIVNSSIPVDWNIVQTSHNVTSVGNKTVLGLIVSNNTLSAQNDTKLEVSHYLKVNGKIDLVGKSQLLQTLNSDLDPTSSGSLERDQQGTSNKYNYNYWCSPVGNPNSTTNNNNYTVNSVLRDGTTTTPQTILWTSANDAIAGSPITLSNKWIYKFQSSSNNYANWIYVGHTGALKAAQGFTMKGSAAATPNQNYTFVGKPNNGKIQYNIGPNLLNLAGNPYTSALDATAFINDNLTSTTGTLYFWDHFGGETHVLLSYLGGYAARNLVGGVVAMSQPELEDIGPGSKAPNRYVPVGQGFFVTSSNIGGDMIFNNNQRQFAKENHADSNAMFRNGNRTIPHANHFENNSENLGEDPDNFIKIRLGFDSRNNYHRQILLGFMNENASSEIEPGYDAIHIDSQVNDMYFIHNGTKLVIQGDGYFNTDSIYPLAVKADAAGNVKFMLDKVENLDEDQEVYIFDNMTGIYHSIKNNIFQVNLDAGLHDRRFSLRFSTTENLGTVDHGLEEGIDIAFTSNNNILHIKNKLLDTTITSVEAYTLLGQNLRSWNVENEIQQNIQIPISNLSTGAYIVKVKTTKGDLSTKIIVR
ncbi:hypothetical protein GGR22_000743 [Flavobacterium gossypii]|uniref:LamG-like jellyroll fold domain-containing protein n=1 Tax=Flavobacterium gossypii TaxID=1646119 RepID=A0ABR6DLQ6_9FLAO|nr:LamG-like jellyroll fold domain-containing protein [Flavobacterium gossypii]MBA9072617.1 hypothetical protein [Flavobacterium gossypii]